MFRVKNRIVALLAATTVGTFGLSEMSSPAPFRMSLDVAMNGLTFSHEGGINQNGAPEAGTPFIIQGYIYPGGTFARHGDLSGVLPGGAPEFPDLVMGTWTCRGWHLQDGDAATGPVVSTTQTFDFDLSEPGSTAITTDGLELADFDVPFVRTIVGGSGKFNGLTGEHRQVYVGHGVNVTGGFNTSFDFTLSGDRGY